MSSLSPNNASEDLPTWAVLDDRGGLYLTDAPTPDEALGKWFSQRPRRLPHPIDDDTYSGRLVRYSWTEREDAGLSTVRVVKRACIVCSTDYVEPSDAPGSAGIGAGEVAA